MPRKRRRSSRKPPPSAPLESVHPTLDLHGHTAEEARRRTGYWLREAREDGLRTVRVVTGRGLHSQGPPVLPGEIESLLRELKGSVVSDYSRAPGGGAYLVELRRRDRERRHAVSASARLPSDPELRRRAEESLWELGITPTPTLIAAEVRRLQQERDEEG